MPPRVDTLSPAAGDSTNRGAPVRYRRLAAVLAIILLALGLWNLDGPGMWWDEGWTLSVARNWAEQGRYIRLLDGQPAAPGLEAAPTVTLPVALSMRLLGVGLWQGRLFGVICATSALLLLAALAARLYDGRVAVAALAAALLLTPHPQINPLLQGRQVLAEMPMLAYLLGGYLCVWWALAGRRLLGVPAALLFGLAWVSKGQTAPFLLMSLAAPAVLALARRRWAAAATWAGMLVGAYLVAVGLRLAMRIFLFEPGLAPGSVSGLLDVLAIVLTPFNRVYAVTNLLTFGLPALLGLLWALPRMWREVAAGRSHASATSDLRLALIVFSGSWLVWFAALSVGVPRYMAAPAFVGCIFLAAMLRDLTAGFDIPRSIERLTGLLSLRRPGWAGARALLALLIVATALPLTLLGLARYYPVTDRSAQRVAAALNAMPAGTRVETYESELHFLLNQPYHYPPDQLHVELNRRSLLGQETPVDYDPLAADPDILVVGTFASGNNLYAPELASGAFSPLMRDGVYTLYARAR